MPRVTFVVALLPLVAACGSAPGSAAPAPAPPAPSSPECAAAAAQRARVPVLLGEGRLDRAVRVLQRADARCPAPESWAVLVGTLAELGRGDDVRRTANAIEAASDAPAEARAAAKRAREAIAALEGASFDDKARLAMSQAFGAAMHAREKKQHAEARKGFLEAWSLFHPNGRALFWAGLEAKELGDGAGAQRLFDRAMVELERATGRAVVPEATNPVPGVPLQLAWSRDGHLLAVATTQGVSIRDRRLDFHETARLEGHTGEVKVVAFSPDGNSVASASEDGTLRLWSVASGVEIRRFAKDTKTLSSLAFSPDGKTLAAGSGAGTVLLWTVATGAEAGRLDARSEVTSIAFSPDGATVASGSTDYAVRLWSIAKGTVTRTLRVPTPPPSELAPGFAPQPGILSVAFAPDGRTLVSGGAGVRLWSLAKGGESRVLDPAELASAVGFSSDGATVAAATRYGTARLWRAATGQETRNFVGTACNDSVAFSPDQELLGCVGAVWSLFLHSVATGALARTLKLPDVLTHDQKVSFSADGRTVAWRSSAMRLWSLAPATDMRERKWAALEALALSPDGRTVASTRGKDVYLRDVSTGAETRKLSGHKGEGISVTFSRDGRTLASSCWSDGTVRLWNPATGKETHTLKGTSAAFSPDGKTLVSGYGQEVRLIAIETEDITLSLEGHVGPVIAVAFSPDGKLVASASGDKTVRIWSAATGALTGKLEGHTDAVMSVAFSPDSKTLASASRYDKSVRLWNVATGAGLRVLDAKTEGVWTAAGDPLVVLPTFWWPIAGYAFTPGARPRVELLGPDANKPDTRPVCRAGGLTFPFDLCRDRCEVRGLLAKALAGEPLDEDLQ